MSKRIALSGGRFALVDDDDFEELAQYKWWWVSSGPYAYTYMETPKGKQTMVTMHRFLMGVVGQPPSVLVDHENGDTLDNRRKNLRVCNKSQNAANGRAHCDSVSRYKGVSLKPSGKWAAQISISGRNTYLGVFVDEEEAARTYDAAAKKHFGEFAKLNFPEE